MTAGGLACSPAMREATTDTAQPSTPGNNVTPGDLQCEPATAVAAVPAAKQDLESGWSANSLMFLTPPKFCQRVPRWHQNSGGWTLRNPEADGLSKLL
jgi:hypothetical protein